MSNLSKKERKEQKEAAELGAVEKINSEIIPCLFHDKEERSWATVLDKDHYETYALDSPQMRNHLEGLYYQETKRSSGQGEAIPEKLLKKFANPIEHRPDTLSEFENRRQKNRKGVERTPFRFFRYSSPACSARTRASSAPLRAWPRRRRRCSSL